ncbi:hypothetical protein Sulku_2636 (plasmid) [Sulfuricurvum kujiense DSM 16994]|uniref:Uncharacterized protein n=1 Tax=Sulfuricurvum kujiense (strain ATCC BAA-921 / DSM 16994 / JCM 11577 / YK-1) TaxID=709032 RepID=E4U3M3_SULKY|nr:hypothetical protein [Sulfuricurvum kujiense]ADR35289.1 hypothetical protein Sulku_2636 [Sulfuricurvum kujiense DSM 16994]
MFDIFNKWFGIAGVDCADTVKREIYCSSATESSTSMFSNDPVGCGIDLNGNGICDFLESDSFSSSDSFSTFDSGG